MYRKEFFDFLFRKILEIVFLKNLKMESKFLVETPLTIFSGFDLNLPFLQENFRLHI